MSQMSSVKAERALENRAHVRMLLGVQQPAFAAALASAEQDFFTWPARCRPPDMRMLRWPGLAWPGLVLGAQYISAITAPRSRNSRSVLTPAVCMTGCPHRERVVPAAANPTGSPSQRAAQSAG
jgi:hypothetical protein